jgi:hypothetical protein
MYLKRRNARKALIGLGLLATLVVLAMGACGGAGAGGSGEGQAKAKEEVESRPLPKDPQALSPGEYHSVEFKPSLSFKVGKGWINSGGELPDFIELTQLGGFISFDNVKEVYKPGTTNVVEAPKDLVGWLQHHPFLKTSTPEPVTLGGVKGEQLDVLVEDLPEDYSGLCYTGRSDCVDIAPLSDDQAQEETAYFTEGNKRKVFVLEDVKGETVMIWFAAPPEVFDEFAHKAQKVVDSVKWSGS